MSNQAIPSMPIVVKNHAAAECFAELLNGFPSRLATIADNAEKHLEINPQNPTLSDRYFTTTHTTDHCVNVIAA